MRRFLQLLFSMTRMERWLLAVLALLVIASTAVLERRFRLQTTVLMPGSGGTYIEGSVGELQPLNPWFTVQNDVNRDIVSLVFSGLLRYNPHTRAIEEDLATLQPSARSTVYVARLKENLFWHDSTESNPHPVTADDVLFTFETIQHPQFPNTLLKQNFRGVQIQKLDDRTVRFTLDEPYSFFPSNLTLGLLPKRSLEDVPPGRMNEALDFGFAPIGAGPYRFKSVVHTDLSSEVTLERFPRSLQPIHRLDRVVFRIFPDYSTLLSDIRNLEGVRLVPRNPQGEPIVPKRFEALEYTLPQYVALYLNLDRPDLQDQKLRVGLQQGTDKQAIADLLHEKVIVDTPLLEIDTSDWRYKFDLDAAQGALLASKWNLPERVRLQRVLEEDDANAAGIVHPPSPVVLLLEGQGLTLTGSIIALPKDFAINGLRLPPKAGTGAWALTLPFLHGTGSLQPGTNLVKVTGEKGRIIDSFYVYGAKTPDEFLRAHEERRLAHLYVATKDGRLEGGSTSLTIGSLTIENGLLRLRKSSDPPSIRINERREPLTLTLFTSDAPPSYKRVAEEVQRQWAKLGVNIQVDIAQTPGDFEDRLIKRDYDILLFGQSLLDNLDSFPYWHSSGVQKLTGQERDLRRDAYNLSQYRSFKADELLHEIRTTNDERERQQALLRLREVLKQDVPAIFLYSPTYIFAHRKDIFGIDLGSLSLHSDRFLTLYKWYVKHERVFRPGIQWWSFFSWLLRGGRVGP